MDRATRFQLALGAGAFVAWGLLAWWDVVTAGERIGSFQRLGVHRGLLAVAGFGNLVTGLAWHLAGTLWARRPPHEMGPMGTGAALTVAGFAMAWTAVPALGTRPVWLPDLARWAMVAGAGGYGAGTFAQRFVTAPRRGAKRYAWSGAADALHLVTAAHALIVAWLLMGDGAFAHAWFHVWTLGVLVATVATVLLHLLPRFRVDAPKTVVPWLVVATMTTAPALLTWGFVRGDLFHFAPASGAVLVLALLALVSVVDSTHQNRRDPQPFVPVLIVALLMGIAGTAIGAAVAYGSVPWTKLPVHAVLLLLGFLGTMIIGMGSVLLGMPRIEWQGRRVEPLGVIATTWIVGLVGWAIWQYATVPPRQLDMVPATLVLVLGVGLITRVQALGPAR